MKNFLKRLILCDAGFLGIGSKSQDDVNAAAAAQAAADSAYFETQRQAVMDQAMAAANSFVAGQRADLNAQSAAVTEHANLVNSVARDLDNNLSGFMTGALQPLYKTTDANVNMRSDSPAQSYIAKDVIQQGISTGTVAVILGLAYFFFKGRK